MPVGYAHDPARRRPRQRMLTYFTLVSVLLTGCAPPDHTGIADLLAQIERSDTHEDLDGVLACYSGDVTWFTPDGSVVRGIDTVRSRYQQLFAENDLDVTIRAENIHMGEGVASVSGLTRVRRTPRAGGASVTSRDRFIMLARDSKAGWRVHMLAWWPEPSGGKQLQLSQP